MISLHKELCRAVGALDSDFIKSERQITLNLSFLTWELIACEEELRDLPFDAALSQLLEEWAADKFVKTMKMEQARQRLKSGDSLERKKFLYFIRRGSDGPIKIGIAEDVEQRRRALSTGSAERLYVLLSIPQTNEINERSIHEKFDHLRQSGEWFDPSTDLLEYIDELRKRAERDDE